MKGITNRQHKILADHMDIYQFMLDIYEKEMLRVDITYYKHLMQRKNTQSQFKMKQESMSAGQVCGGLHKII